MKSFVICSLLILAMRAQATVHWVWPDLCIQTAVDSAVELDTIAIGDGSYFESIVPYGKSLTIGSHFLLDGDTSHIAHTIIRPGTTRPDTHSCVVYAYSEPEGNRLVGLTLRDGTGTWDAESPSFNGGGIYARSSSVSIEHCRITNCTAERFGGGVLAFDEDTSLRTHFDMLDCTIDSCSAGYFGGGFAISQERVSMRRCCFRDNWSGLSAGGGQLLHCQGDVDSCVFSHNFADSREGGLMMGWGWGNVTNCLFDSNGTVMWPPFPSGQLSYVNMEGVVSGCTFRHSQSRGSSVYFYTQGGQAVRFVHNIIEDNVTEDYVSTAQFVYPHGGEIAYNVFRGNTGYWCGAVGIGGQGSTLRIHHNVFQNNVSEARVNASVAETVIEPCMSLDSNWISGNSYETVGLYDQMTPCVVDARNNWWGHPSGPYHPTQNPGGQGDTLISDSVLFIPWLTEPPDTTMPPGYLSVHLPREIAKTWELMDAYPNPFNQAMTLVLAGFSGADFEIGLYNLLGQQVDVVHRGALAGGQLHYQAPPWLASGVYLLSARDKHSIQTKKVILMK